MTADEPDPRRWKRPTMDFERKAVGPPAAWRWSAAGLEFAVVVVLFFLGGSWLDGKLGTAPWLTVVGSMVGIALGTYLMLRPVLRGQVRSDDHADGRADEGHRERDDAQT